MAAMEEAFRPGFECNNYLIFHKIRAVLEVTLHINIRETQI